MSHRLTFPEFHVIRYLLAAGWRHTQIAREMNLSVWTIQRLASDRSLEREDLEEHELPEDDAPADYQSQDLRRCSSCGAMVYVWPCLACRESTSARS
jgi:hypothetical protein